MKILLVEDDPLQCTILADYLKGCGHEVDTSSTGEHANELMDADPYDVAVIDLVLAVSTGDTVAQRAYHKGLAVVLMSATSESQLAEIKESVELTGCKVHQTLKKPFSPQTLLATINEAIRVKNMPPQVPA